MGATRPKTPTKIATLLMTSILILNITATSKADGVEEAAEGEFLVRLEEGVSNAEAVLKNSSLEIIRKIEALDLYLVKSKVESTAMDRPQAPAIDPNIKHIEPNFILRTTDLGHIKINMTRTSQPDSIVTKSAPNDTLWTSDPWTGIGQWNMRIIDAEKAWTLARGSQEIVVAIVDSGIYWRHGDLATNYKPGGFDWVNLDTDPNDDFGHGSWVAGIIAAETNNGLGVAGMAQVSLIAEKVISRTGSGTLANLISGIVHAADLGVDVINLSLGTYEYSGFLENAIEYAHEKGCLLVAAAGNDDTESPHYPAAFEEVLGIAATYGEPNDVKTTYSNHGSWIALSAPGGWDSNRNGNPDPGEYWVISPSNHRDEYFIGTGTSASAPHVSGLAALYKSLHPNATNEEIVGALKMSAVDKGAPEWDELYGYGRIDAYATLRSRPSSVGGVGTKIEPVSIEVGGHSIDISTMISIMLAASLVIGKSKFLKWRR